MADLPTVEIYTDGACSGNPGPGGWAALLRFGDKEKELAGFERNTTNNRMELMGVIAGLKSLNKTCDVKIYADSAYIVNCFHEGWLENWKRNGWRRGKKKEPVLNEDLWRELDLLVAKHEVEFVKVKGHAGHEFNERVDRLAVEQIEQNR